MGAWSALEMSMALYGYLLCRVKRALGFEIAVLE